MIKNKKKKIVLPGDNYLCFEKLSEVYRTHSEIFESFMLMNDIDIHHYELFLLGK